MAEITLIIRTADKTKKAEVKLESGSTGADVIQAAVDNWTLPSDTDYTLVNASQNKSVVPTDTLEKSGVKTGEILEVQPVLVAGMTE